VIGDVVQLANGSVGVVGEILPHGLSRVYFDRSYKDVLDAEISSTLSAPAYSVGDTVSIWPHSGDITSIDGDTFTVSIDRQTIFPDGFNVTWSGDFQAPRWRIIRDNDTRISRVW